MASGQALLGRLATALIGAGFELSATVGTARALAKLGYPARLVAKTATTAIPDVGDGVPILELIRSAAEALDPAVAGRISEVRSLGQWVPSGPLVMARS